MSGIPPDGGAGDAVVAAALIAAQGIEQVTGVVEDVHARIARPRWRGREPGRTRGITGFVYGTVRLAVRGTTSLLRIFAARERRVALTPARREAAVRAVVNGLIANTGNALAIPMVLRRGGAVLPMEPAALAAAVPEATGRVVVLIHGLCMNDLQWDLRGTGDYGAALARDLGWTPVYLHYNTGRHISTNGRELAALLESLTGAWPVPIERMAIVGHSMGGMVARSACHHATVAGHGWMEKLRTLVFLATPHHGSPLERHGNALETALAGIPHAAPFARLGRMRSAGITDLRHGNLLDEDWQGRDRFERGGDARSVVPLPAGVACCAIAATRGTRPGGFGERVWGDGLVPLSSALGDHPEPWRGLGIPPERRCVLYRTSHVGLLQSAAAYERIRGWLAEAG